MTEQEAKDCLEFIKMAYENLIENGADSYRAVGENTDCEVEVDRKRKNYYQVQYSNLAEALGIGINALQENQQYHALGPVAELEEDALMVRADRILLDEYMKLGSVEECRKAVEKQIAKKPKHVVEKYGKHKWKRNENGEIDDFAWDYGYHNGVVCEVCGESVCVHCEPDYDNKEDCEKSYYVCPTCGEITFRKTYCDCGQKLDWREE